MNVGNDRSEVDHKLEDYHRVADTVGFIPGLRMKDNVFQAVFILMSILIGCVFGFVVMGSLGAIVGALVAMIVGLFSSGIILMIVGWVRAMKSR